MNWKIVTDSASDLYPSQWREECCGLGTVPFIIHIGEQDYEDNESLDTLALLDHMESCKEAGSTGCPSPLAWKEEFREADRVIALTISSQLSGSFNSACLGRDMLLSEEPDKQVEILDSFATGPAMVMCVENIREAVKAGKDFDTVVREASQLLQETRTIFALSSFENLVKNGRMHKLAGLLAKSLGMWGVGIGKEGQIAIKGKTRGVKRALSIIIDDIEERGFHSREMFISHCHNLTVAEELRDRVKERWQDAKVTIMKTRGLDSFYAERGGLIVAYR